MEEYMADQVLEAQAILERFHLGGRVALVTGGGRGIGRAFAHALGEAGAAVAVSALHKETAETVADELAKKDIDSIAIVADVKKIDHIERMVKTVVDHWGSLTIGVNNAGVGAWVDAIDVTIADWDEIMDVNLRGVFFCAQAEARVMKEKEYGKIVNVASMSAHIVNRPQKASPYLISKAGVVHLTRSLAAEWAPHSILVNSISPGYTMTKQLGDLAETPEGRPMVPKWLSYTPLGRMAKLTDLQGAVVFLASEVSDFITGIDLVIDGGYTLW
jgi:NAD(P)-dependent dehydrogenase (short-subunit alcohol dehydrogenase family)